MTDTAADWKRRSDAWEKLARDLDAENDDLRRDNERMLKALAASNKASCPPTERSLKAPAAALEMCCGGTTVRAVCTFHGPQARP